MKTRKKVLATLVIAALVVGCGGKDDNATQPAQGASGSPVKVEFIKRADAICEEADKAQEAGLKDYLKKTPSAQYSKAGQSKMVVAAGLPPIRDESEKLTALEVPDGEEAAVNAIFTGIEVAIRESEKDPGSLLSGSKNAFTDVGKLASRYGFDACSSAF